MSEPLIKIPGTTYSLQFGVEGKYYAVFLVQGRQAIKSQKLSILKGMASEELPDEIENGLISLLETENIFINRVVVDRVVNDLLNTVPLEEDQQPQIVKHDEPKEERLVPESISVKDMIARSDGRAGIKSVVEHKPKEKSKYDASAENIGDYNLKKAKPLPKKEGMVEEYKPTFQTIEKPERPTKTIESKPEPEMFTQEKMPATDKYVQLEEKISTLTNNVEQLLNEVSKNKKQISSLKGQVTKLKKSLSEADKNKE